MKTLLLCLLVLPALAWADGAVLLFAAVGSEHRVALSGRVFKDEARGSTTLSRNLRRLTATNWEGAAVEVRFAGRSLNVVSGHDGNFEAVFEEAAPKRFPVGGHKAEALVKGARTGVATLEVLAASAPFFVVSDFDDTVAVSEVLSKRRLAGNVLLRDEATQPLVKGMPELYGCLRENPGQPAFALVSGSPVQFGNRIGTFLSNHRFPPMGIYLRDLGPTTLKGYKQPIIRALLRAIPNKAVLVGDSGEHDPEVYRQMVEEFPDRVLRTYIRNAGRAGDKARFANMVLFDEPKDAARDAVEQGLITRECFERAFK